MPRWCLRSLRSRAPTDPSASNVVLRAAGGNAVPEYTSTTFQGAVGSLVFDEAFTSIRFTPSSRSGGFNQTRWVCCPK